ncbi:MAG: sigma-70 family RNA polymerase sigma factor [Phycisphaerales bacterium]|nr:sigma-70 family RNA polymerase sigma factor [Phycisphaerales bacterium]
MEPTPTQHVTRLIKAAGAGDPKAAESLLPLVYDELRRLAAAQLSKEPAGQTLQPTALVHEAYLRLVGGEAIEWQGRGHFFAAAARAMRRILIDRARRHRAAKHGGDRARADLREDLIADPTPATAGAGMDLLRLDAALARLETRDSRQAEIVLLRYFAGLSIEQTAEALGVSTGTVKNDWVFARAWLRRELESIGEGEIG